MKYTSHEDIKAIIREAAKRHGITLTAAGERLGLPSSNTSRLFNNTRMNIYQLSQIAAALGCDLYIELRDRETEQP